MNLKPQEPVIDLPGASVATIVVVHQRSPKGRIKRSTALMRMSEAELGRLPDNPHLFAMPTYWCPTRDGKIAVWPRPDAAYDIEVMGVGGKPLGDSRRPTIVIPTVTEFAAAVQRSYDDQQRNSVVAQKIERFTLASDE